jgi:hypothetical protein
MNGAVVDAVVDVVDVVADDAFLGCSLRMLDAARAGEWDALIELECERRALPTPAEPAHPDAGRLRRLLEINDEIIALSAGHRDALMRAFNSNKQQQRAAGAYSGRRG